MDGVVHHILAAVEILRCRTCGARQPRDWAPGDLCVACGAAARPELRCPACVAWSPEGRFCRECGCELPSRDRYGVARMLAAAGVDRFSLGARLRELDPGQAETLAAQYATQWAIASRRLDEAALCEGFLRTRGHTVGLEEALARELPFPPARRRELEGGPPGPFEGRDDLLPAVLAQSPLELNRSLAALALLRRDRVSDAAVERARAALHGQALATEAALALAAWPVRGEARLDRRELARVDEVARAALPVPSLAAAAAVACAWAERAEPLPEELAGPLREGLTGKDAVLRFDCALALGDEAALGAALDSEDERVRRLARRRLGALGSVVLVPSLAGGDEAARRDAAAGLQPPLSDRLVGAWLGGARGDAAKREALAFVRRARFEAYTPAARGEIAAWARREAVALGAEEILETLSWAAGDDRGGDAAALGNEGPAWLAAAHEALRALPVAALPERLRGTAFGRYLALDPGGALPLLLGWIGQAPALDAALRALLRQHAALQRERPDTRMSSLLLQLWDRAERDRPVLAASLARVLAGERGMAGRASVLEGFWQRFRERPSERRDVLAALAPWKQQLFELRDAEPPEGSLHGGDA
ncbi:MAG TPA: zinc ribbon domain-containing protein, partial [Myxococcales bacterium]|nr:zinc ribbon domain-containing protein [Myxococcales bacterium]